MGHALAELLGWDSVDWGLRQMSSKELLRWEAWQNENGPISPSQRADLHNARLMAHIAELFRDQDKRPKPFTVNDFMPDYSAAIETNEGESPLVSRERTLAWMRSLAATYDGVTLTHGKPG